jgi:hypothetical protein
MKLKVLVAHSFPFALPPGVQCLLRAGMKNCLKSSENSAMKMKVLVAHSLPFVLPQLALALKSINQIQQVTGFSAGIFHMYRRKVFAISAEQPKKGRSTLNHQVLQLVPPQLVTTNLLLKLQPTTTNRVLELLQHRPAVCVADFGIQQK